MSTTRGCDTFSPIPLIQVRIVLGAKTFAMVRVDWDRIRTNDVRTFNLIVFDAISFLMIQECIAHAMLQCCFKTLN